MLKKYYQEKLNMLFGHLQEENNAIVMFKMRQEMSYLKKKIVELEKSQTSKYLTNKYLLFILNFNN